MQPQIIQPYNTFYPYYIHKYLLTQLEYIVDSTYKYSYSSGFIYEPSYMTVNWGVAEIINANTYCKLTRGLRLTSVNILLLWPTCVCK